MNNLLNVADSFMWGPVTIVLLVGTGILMAFLLKFIQGRHFIYAWKLLSGKYDNPDDDGEVTHFQALSTALSSTIGVGNIAGVGTAVALGGPGAIFWMWITAVFGMGLKYCECLLSLNFRTIHKNGVVGAGPMYYLEKGMGQKWLAILFALFAAIASFGIGDMVQANSVAQPILVSFHIPKIATGLILGVLCFLVIVGGVKRIAKFASMIVPFMCVVYVISALVVIFTHLGSVPTAFAVIFHNAFAGTAMTGGFAGAGVAQAVRFGVARGVFSNEAGLGSAPIAHGAAQTKEPVREGLVAMLGPFIDTIVVCTMTGLVIIMTNAYTLLNAGGKALSGANLTAKAFSLGLPFNDHGYLVAISIIFFAFSTLVGWSYYGDRCVDYLFGEKMVLPYRILYCILIPVGATIELTTVWTISDIFNACMAWPNLVGILFLCPVVMKMTKEYFLDPKRVNPDYAK